MRIMDGISPGVTSAHPPRQQGAVEGRKVEAKKIVIYKEALRWRLMLCYIGSRADIQRGPVEHRRREEVIKSLFI